MPTFLSPFRTVLIAMAITIATVMATANWGITTAQARGVPNGFSDVVDRVYGAVGNVIVSVKSNDQSRQGELDKFLESMPEEFREKFKDRFMPNGQEKNGDLPSLLSQGSAFLISDDGYMVTNNHVIKGATEIKISLNNDDTVYKATVIGTDSKTDIALIKIKSNKKLPYVKIGNSDQMKLGDWVIAVGNPLGFGGTVTAGIISSDSRYLGSGPYDNYIQTDAAINRGNSGGPLFNMNGEVIGVNTLIVSTTGQYSGLGFAIPSKQMQQVVEQLKQYGTTRRGWLGVSIQYVSKAIADGLGLDKPRGALIEGLHPEGPSLKSGIKIGDIILKFNGKTVATSKDLPRMVANTSVGKTVPVELWRDGKIVTVKIKLGELEKADLTQSHNGKITEETKKSKTKGETILGLELSEYTEKLAKKYNLPEQGQGVIVTGITPNSPAQKSGITPGMIITHINKTPITTIPEFKKTLQSVKKMGRGSALLRAGTGTQSRYVVVRFGE